MDAFCALPKNLKGCTFDAFNLDRDITAQQASALQGAYNAALELANREAPSWLVLFGSVGCGKTHLAAAICNARLDDPDLGPIGKFVTCPDLLAQLRAGYDDGTYETTLTMYRDIPLLVLDDFGSEYRKRPANGDSGPSWAEEQLYLILNHRYVHEFETVVTSNAPVDSLNVRLRDRLLDTGTGLCRVFHLQLPSYRTGRTAT